MVGNKKPIFIITLILIITSIFYLGGTPEENKIIKSKPLIDSTLIRLKNKFEGFESIVENGIKENRCPGAAIVVIKDTSIILMRGFGSREAGGADLVDEHTVFRLGSLSKGFAAITSGILVEQGFFSWEDKVVDYFPGFELKSKEQTNRIRIQNILSHTSGLPRHSYTNLIEEGWSIDEIAAILKEVDPAGEEGKIFAYQNAAYSLIEKIIESTTHKKYSDILQQEVFKEVGMGDASCSYDSIINKKDIAFPHRTIALNSYKKIPITKKYYNSVSSGGVNASISDMANWLQLLLGNKPGILNDSTLNRIFQPVINTSNERKFYNRWEKTGASYYALGWRVIDYNGHRIIYHGGFVNGYRSEIAFDRDRKIAVCALFNAPCEYSSQIVHDFIDYFDNHVSASEENYLAEISKKH